MKTPAVFGHSATPQDAVAAPVAAADQSAKPRRRHGPPTRPYPRRPSEVGVTVGRDRVPVAGLPMFHELERSIVEDLGGDTAVSVAKLEVLRMALKALAIVEVLAAEVSDKARVSRKTGHIPYPSRYRALDPLARFMDLSARLLRDVGLGRKAKRVDLEAYLRERATAPAPQGEAIANADEPSIAAADDRVTTADSASETTERVTS